MMFSAVKTICGIHRSLGDFGDKKKALNHVMCDIMAEIGEGDCENGGKGSLWKCAGEIYDTLEKGEEYSYADCSWRIVGSGDKSFCFMCLVKVSKMIVVTDKIDKYETVVKLNALSLFETELAELLGGKGYEFHERMAIAMENHLD